MKSNRKSSKAHKGIRLSSGTWIKASEIKDVRDKVLKAQGGVCAISGVKLSTGALDHNHTTGAIRGVLLSEINMLEGRFLKSFNKLKLNEKYGIDFATMLVNMGTYLQEDFSEERLHYKLMEDFRKKLNRNTSPLIKDMLISDFKIEGEGTKRDLVQLYVQAWVDKISKQ